MSADTSQALDTARSAQAEASAWLAQLHGSQRSAELEADFRAWLAADPHNARAFEKVTDVWDALGSVNVGGLPRLAAHEPFVERRSFFKVSLAAVAAVIVAVCAVWFFRAPSYSTDIGEQRIVSLADGTRVSLNSATAIDVDFNDTERLIRLRQGEALFEVAQNVSRPFIVIAGDRRIVALGTSFVVRHDSDRTAVTLVSGKVAVSSLSPPPRAGEGQRGSIEYLAPGQRLTIQPNHAQTLDSPRPEVATAWRRGEVILDEMPLSEAIEEMNRYDRTRLAIDDPSIARLPVSGIYRSGNNRDFAHAVATMYGLEVVPEGDALHLGRGDKGN